MSSRREVLAIIPARGGSKGIPRKNLVQVNGVPLLARMIELAQGSSLITRTAVSTEDEEIAALSSSWGAEVVRRPSEMAGDHSSSEAALLHVVETLRQVDDYVPEALAFLQCTSPLIQAADIDGTLRLVLEDGYDSAVTMTPFHHFVWQESPEGKLTGINHDDGKRLMRQDRNREYLEVGAVYAMRTDGFLGHRYRFFGKIGRYMIPAYRSLEIDSEEDLRLAEVLARSDLSGAKEFYRPYDASASLRHALSQTKILVTDFDGVMTDNTVMVREDGVESVNCNRSDGWGIDQLKEMGVTVVCLSTERNPVVQARCSKLRIECRQGAENKVEQLKDVLEMKGFSAKECLYVGNDTNDLDCLEYAGVAVVPADAAIEVLPLADVITKANGGEGVLREVARLLVKFAGQGG